MDRTVLYHWRRTTPGEAGSADASPVRELLKEIRDLRRVLAGRALEAEFFHFAEPSWRRSPALHLQNIAIVGDHFVEYRIHKEPDEEPGNQPGNDNDCERLLRVGTNSSRERRR